MLYSVKCNEKNQEIIKSEVLSLSSDLRRADVNETIKMSLLAEVRSRCPLCNNDYIENDKLFPVSRIKFNTN